VPIFLNESTVTDEGKIDLILIFNLLACNLLNELLVFDFGELALHDEQVLQLLVPFISTVIPRFGLHLSRDLASVDLCKIYAAKCFEIDNIQKIFKAVLSFHRSTIILSRLLPNFHQSLPFIRYFYF